jgi:hypothetical protein
VGEFRVRKVLSFLFSLAGARSAPDAKRPEIAGMTSARDDAADSVAGDLGQGRWRDRAGEPGAVVLAGGTWRGRAATRRILVVVSSRAFHPARIQDQPGLAPRVARAATTTAEARHADPGMASAKVAGLR